MTTKHKPVDFSVLVPLQPVDAQDAVLDSSNVVILQVDDAVGVLNDGGGIRGEEVLDLKKKRF